MWLLPEQARPAAGHRAAFVETVEPGDGSTARAAAVLVHEAVIGGAAAAPADESLAGLHALGQRRDARQGCDLLGAARDPALRLHDAQVADRRLLLRVEAAR